MKRIIPVVLFIIVALFLLNFETPGQNDIEKHSLKGKVKSCKTTCYKYTKLDDGRYSLLNDCVDFAGDCYHLDSYFKYNKSGYIVQSKEIPAKWEPEKCEQNKVIHRDKENRITCTEIFDNKENLILREVVEFNSDHTPCRTTEYNNEGQRLSFKEYKYDDKKRPIEVLHYDDSGILTYVSDKCYYLKTGERIIGDSGDTIMFNTKGQLIMEYGSFDDGTCYKNIHEYNKKGERERIVFMVDNDVVEVKTNPYQEVMRSGKIVKSDDNENWLIQVFPGSFSENEGSVVIREIEYY